ncbi:MAG TPA: bifunctional 4-hydroxy-2-oxoglutarate aldolase/2-dehydro-3-deoxy-phosphogluconate aldolase [Blastocatellia bacterium]|nr:bifunctional 4-hydroxy-2-oxoglutarate aldolase/2-dehydro-3-deoxy-phosphogluconate aldolase [Blastocatellia bacterium]
MTVDQIIKQIEAGRIVAILRGDFRGREEEIAASLVEAGITAIEVTLNSPGAFDSINRLSTGFGWAIAIGAGTVMRTDEVERAAGAGARFIVSPNRDANVIGTTKRLGLVSLPGCFTPSEIVEALDAGADAVKLFPAQCLGSDFIKAIRGPLPNIRMVPTGGVTPEAARRYIAAGAWALGVGSELIGKDVMNDKGFESLRRRASEFVEAAWGGAK